jgi:hypothetical protein
MATKWVDNTEYFGPDRRRKPGKRWNDRRRHNEAGQPPPVAGASAEDRRHALEMLKAAISEASRLGWRQCAATLVSADQLLRGGSGATMVAQVDTLIVQAMDHAGAGR